jgi:hypothetical protein
MKNNNNNTPKTGKGIQSYVDYLLEDMKQAEGKLDDPATLTEEPDLSEHFMEMEKMVHEDPLNTFGKICGLSKEQFPPLDQLSKKQIHIIMRAFHQLLSSWNLAIVVPKKLPDSEQYKLIYQLLDQKVHIIKWGTSHIEFCSYEEETCPFGKYCDCKVLLAKYKTTGEKGSGKSKSSSH